MPSFHVKFWTDRWTDRKTPVKQYTPDLFSKVSVAELQFLCTALLHNAFYLCIKFEVDSFYIGLDKNLKQQDVFVKHECHATAIFSKTVTLIFDLDLDR